MNPEQFHTAKTYGDCKIFRKRFIEGYREVAFGMGEWVDNKKMVAIWIFYSPVIIRTTTAITVTPRLIVCW